MSRTEVRQGRKSREKPEVSGEGSDGASPP